MFLSIASFTRRILSTDQNALHQHEEEKLEQSSEITYIRCRTYLDVRPMSGRIPEDGFIE